MDLEFGLRNRRSIRIYKKKPIELDKIKKIIKLAIMAPSAHNSNPWYFIILNDEKIKRNLIIRMSEKYEQDLRNDGYPIELINIRITTSIKRFMESPIIIVPCLDMSKMDKYPDIKRQMIEHQMGVQSVAAAIQNLLLAAFNEGLASCWYCAPLFVKKIVCECLNIPDYIEPQAFITIGYPISDKPPKPPPRPKIEDICFLNRWGERF